MAARAILDELVRVGAVERLEDFMERALREGMSFCTLGSLLPEDTSDLPSGTVDKGLVPGREGWVAVQR